MKRPVRAILFDYGGTLVQNWPSEGQSRPEPGLHSALRRLAPRYQFGIADNGEASAAAIQMDLGRLGLADLFATVRSAESADPAVWRATVEAALADLDVSPSDAILVSRCEETPPIPEIRAICYRPSGRWLARLRAEIEADDDLALLTTFDHLQRAVACLEAGTGIPRNWKSATRLGALLMGAAFGTAAAYYIRQRYEDERRAAEE